MKKIQKLVDQIKEELEGAKEYAECYLDFKSQNNSSWANKYKQMADQELSHAMTIHDRAVEEINSLSKVYSPPVEMSEEWDKEHKRFVEQTAWIRQMLAM